MKYIAALFCFVAVVKAASIGGQASITKDAFSVGGAVVIPRMPAINAPMSNIFLRLSRQPTNSTSNANSGPRLNNLLNLFDVPDPSSLVPDLPSNVDPSEIEVPLIPALTDLSELPSIPGLPTAVKDAREHVAEALLLGTNITAGIQQAVQDAFGNGNTTVAVRDIVQTVLSNYLTVAARCPLIVVGSRVLQEGIRLAIEVARSATNVVLGTTSSPI